MFIENSQDVVPGFRQCQFLADITAGEELCNCREGLEMLVIVFLWDEEKDNEVNRVVVDCFKIDTFL